MATHANGYSHHRGRPYFDVLFLQASDTGLAFQLSELRDSQIYVQQDPVTQYLHDLIENPSSESGVVELDVRGTNSA